MNIFYEGQIFKDEYPPEAAEWCNESQEFHIEEIDSDGETRQFQIVENIHQSEPEPYIDPMDEIDEAICGLYEMILEVQNAQS